MDRFFFVGFSSVVCWMTWQCLCAPRIVICEQGLLIRGPFSMDHLSWSVIRAVEGV
jgi:hypothetical protein